MSERYLIINLNNELLIINYILLISITFSQNLRISKYCIVIENVMKIL
jgi:hypothetical protein